MPFVTSAQGSALLFYIDYRPSAHVTLRPKRDAFVQNKQKTLFFLQGWPTSGRTFQHLMLPLSQTRGVRCVASDRRGFGRSEWQGPESVEVTYNTFADDTFAIAKSVKDLGQIMFVASSMGCGESLLIYEQMRKHELEQQAKALSEWVRACHIH